MRHIPAGAAALAALAGVALLAGCASSAQKADTGSGTTAVTGSVTSTASEPTTSADTPSSSSAPSSTAASTTVAPQPGQPCVTASLQASLGAPEGAAGSSYYSLVFTNTGSVSCTLQGFPGVSYVTGDSGTEVGGSASWDGVKGPAVTLQPGGTASAQLQQVNVQNFPTNVCDPVATRGLRVYPPGEKAALFVPQPDGLGCRANPLPGGQFQMSVQTIKAG